MEHLFRKLIKYLQTFFPSFFTPQHLLCYVGTEIALLL